jgi:hypothetical protein
MGMGWGHPGLWRRRQSAIGKGERMLELINEFIFGHKICTIDILNQKERFNFSLLAGWNEFQV